MGTMKTKSLFILFVSALVICSCAVSKIDNPHLDKTPGCVAINETLLCDQFEVSNFGWIEYSAWTGNTFGYESPEFLATIPDTNVWLEFPCLDEHNLYYWKHIAYRHYPLIGISQEQAHSYSQWRSDRVFEYNLIKEKVIHYNSDQSSENYFSISNYFSGKYLDRITQKDTSILVPTTPNFDLLYPDYHLPDSTERLAILDYVDSTDYIFHQEKPRKYENWRMENLPFQLAIEPCDTTVYKQEGTRKVDPYLDPKNKYGLISNSRGNVAEWGAESSITYGGGWPHNVEYVLSKDTISCTEPNAWTGMRNVCTWKHWEKRE